MSSKEYVAERVGAALAEARGNAGEAQRLLIAQCARDGRLLRGLVMPYLQGIVAHAVGRAGASGSRAGTERAVEIPSTAMDTVVGQLGRAIGETRLPRGMTALTESPSRPAAGTRHQDAIRRIADSYKRKRGAD